MDQRRARDQREFYLRMAPRNLAGLGRQLHGIFFIHSRRQEFF